MNWREKILSSNHPRRSWTGTRMGNLWFNAIGRSLSPPRMTVATRWAVIALAAAVILVFVVRLRLLAIPLERDEGEYAYAGQLLLEGIPPYKLAYNMKLPGTYAAYAAMMALFGQTTEGIHLGFLVVVLATLALLFCVARRLLGLPHAVVACVCYALLSMCPGVLGLEGHATHLVVLPVLGGLLLLLKARESKRLSGFAWSGVCFGLSFVCKQPGLFFCMFGLSVLLRDWELAARPARRAAFGRACLFCGGLALPFLLTCLLIWWAGTFDRFWFWTMVYARTHATLLNARDAVADFESFWKLAGAMRWWWIPAGAGLIGLLCDKKRGEARFIIGALAAFSLIAFTASFYFTRHYFIMMLPVVCLLIAAAERQAAALLPQKALDVSFALACALFIFVNRSLWFQQTPDQVSRFLYDRNPFLEAAPIARRIAQDMKAGDNIAVLGSEPEIYFYARRHSAIPYIYMYDLMQPHRYSLMMQQEVIHDLETAKPAYLLIIYISTSWYFSQDSNQPLLKWLPGYNEAYYDWVGMAWLLPDRTEYLWGAEALKRSFDTPLRIGILKRKPGV